MALGSDHVTITSAATFIPEIWSDEIVAAYKKNLVAANLFKKMSFVGKKGDTVHIPSPTRGVAAIKAANAQAAFYLSLRAQPEPIFSEITFDLTNPELDNSDRDNLIGIFMGEAIVVIANDGTLLKAEANPYMMKDRPILAYQDDTVPNRLLGRGTVEKAYNSQKN